MDEREKDARREDVEELKAALATAGATKFRGRECCCPWHGDKHASMSLFKGEDGFWRAKCHPCGWKGDVWDVEAKIQNKDVAQVLADFKGRIMQKPAPRPAQQQPKTWRSWESIRDWLATKGRVEDVYPYSRELGAQPDLVVFRYVPAATEDDPEPRKKFMQCHSVANGWLIGAPPAPWPLFNRARLAKVKKALVVEGEKTVKRLVALGLDGEKFPLTVTSSPCGAGKAAMADWSPLDGFEEVWLWPDHDAPDPKRNNVIAGTAHMREVADCINRLPHPPKLYWLDPDLLGLAQEGDDACEWIDVHGGPVQPDGTVLIEPDTARLAVLRMIERVGRPITAAEPVFERMQQIVAGKRRTESSPFARLDAYSRWLKVGTVVLLAGPPGKKKSWLLLQCIRWWAKHGVPTAAYELEEDMAYHALRALAQKEGRAEMLDEGWCELNGAEYMALGRKHQAMLDELAVRIYATPRKIVTLSDLGDWVEARLKDGNRIVAIDPITVAKASKNRFIEDQDFVFRCKILAQDYGATIILVSHPKQGEAGRSGDVSDAAGGAAYSRFVDTMVWVTGLEEPEPLTVDGIAGPTIVNVHAAWELRKVRNGPGDGLKIGVSFEQLSFKEVGLINGEGRSLPHVDTGEVPV